MSRSTLSPELKARWVAALRSGEYKQAQGLLKKPASDGTYRYCCLGVLKAIEPSIRGRAQPSALGRVIESTAFLELADCGLRYDDQVDLAGMNDSNKHSFESIANYIEENL